MNRRYSLLLLKVDLIRAAILLGLLCAFAIDANTHHAVARHLAHYLLTLPQEINR